MYDLQSGDLIQQRPRNSCQSWRIVGLVIDVNADPVLPEGLVIDMLNEHGVNETYWHDRLSLSVWSVAYNRSIRVTREGEIIWSSEEQE